MADRNVRDHLDVLAVKFNERLDSVVGADIKKLKLLLEQELDSYKERAQRTEATYQAYGRHSVFLDRVREGKDTEPVTKTESLVAEIHGKIESDPELIQIMPSELFRDGWLARVFNDIAKQ